MKREEFKKTFFQGEKKDYTVVWKEGWWREKDEWRCGLATFQRASAKVKKRDEPWDLKSVWVKVVPLTVLSFSFAEFAFTLVAIMLVSSHLCPFPSKFPLRCLLLSGVAFRFGWLLPFSNHCSSSRTRLSFYSACVCVCVLDFFL